MIIPRPTVLLPGCFTILAWGCPVAMRTNGSVLTVLPTARPMSDAADASGLDTSVGKALAVLASSPRGRHPAQSIAESPSGRPYRRSTAHRLLNLLVEHGYIERVDARYRLSRAIFELGNMISDCRPCSMRRDRDAVHDRVGRESTHATVHLAVLDGDDVLYVEKIYGHHGVNLPSRVGGRVPALCTALGKAILAFSAPDRVEAAVHRPYPLGSRPGRSSTRTVTAEHPGDMCGRLASPTTARGPRSAPAAWPPRY